MKKRTFLLLVCLLCYEKAVYGQTEFIDFAGIGGGYTPHSDVNAGFYFMADYSIGSLFHKIDLAALVDVRAIFPNIDLPDIIMAGGQLDYFGINLFGLGLGGGIAVNRNEEQAY